jgi:hypothetical protein
MQMYDTEKSYVEALKNLVTKYYLPMKDKAVISNDLVNDIFYKIPEIHIHHTVLIVFHSFEYIYIFFRHFLFLFLKNYLNGIINKPLVIFSYKW